MARRSKARRKHKVCGACGYKFSYKIARGADRKFCKRTLCIRHRAQESSRIRREQDYPACKSFHGCTRPATRIGAGLCESCYYQKYRTGSTKRRSPKYRYTNTAGYILLLLPDHPLATKWGNVYEHRKVLYDKLGPGKHDCFWCGDKLSWKKLVVDHLNENKQDNQASNLVVACNKCNRLRGALLGFLKTLQDSSLEPFIHTIRNYHKAKTATLYAIKI